MPVKPAICASCRGILEQPDTGRPRVYCGPACRRLAERKIRVAEQLLARARRSEQTARMRAATDDYGRPPKEAQWWAEEASRCEAELAALLAGSAEDDDESASAAASTLARRRRPQ